MLKIAREFGLSVEELRSWETVLDEELHELLTVNSVECAHCRVKDAPSFIGPEEDGILPVTVRFRCLEMRKIIAFDRVLTVRLQCLASLVVGDLHLHPLDRLFQ